MAAAAILKRRKINDFPFTKFEHNMLIGVSLKTFEQNFKNFTVKSRFLKRRKNFSKKLTSCDLVIVFPNKTQKFR